jgi:DNA (cytosine-5)-methyltransferase 1
MIAGIDLFASAGGLTLGLRTAGVETVCAVEIDPYRVATFAAHSPKADIVAGDIRKVDLSAYRGKVALVYGGPPCQPFSSGGLRRAADDPRDMVPFFVHAVRSVQPAAFLMENVPGLVAGDRFAYLSAVLRELESLKFHVVWRVLNAADFGVPQKRRRLFVVGLRDRPFLFPAETHGPGRERPPRCRARRSAGSPDR